MTAPTQAIRQRLGGGVSLVCGLGGVWAALQLPLGNARLLGPGVIPLVLSLVIAALGSVLLIRPPMTEEAMTRRAAVLMGWPWSAASRS